MRSTTCILLNRALRAQDLLYINRALYAQYHSYTTEQDAACAGPFVHSKCTACAELFSYY